MSAESSALVRERALQELCPDREEVEKDIALLL